MRKHVALMTALALPASVSAHTGSHAEMSLVKGIVHALGQHYAPALALACLVIVAMMFVTRSRVQCETDNHQHNDIDRKER